MVLAGTCVDSGPVLLQVLLQHLPQHTAAQHTAAHPQQYITAALSHMLMLLHLQS
jgi:hypothetical protein